MTQQPPRTSAARKAVPRSVLLLFACLGATAGTARAEEPWEPPLHHVFPIHRGRVGVEIQPMTAELRQYMKAPADRGLLVVSVRTGSAADRAGLEVGDVITEADGTPLARPYDLVRRVASVPEGGSLELRIVRGGEEKGLKVEPEGSAEPWVDPEQWGDWFERGVREGSGQIREQLRQLERRLEELERQMREQSQPDPQKT